MYGDRGACKRIGSAMTGRGQRPYESIRKTSVRRMLRNTIAPVHRRHRHYTRRHARVGFTVAACEPSTGRPGALSVIF